MTKPRYSPLDYLAGSWQILDYSAFEYIFPDESTAWVIEPDGVLHEYRSCAREELLCSAGRISAAWVTYRIFGKEKELNGYGFIPVRLDRLFRLAGEEESTIRYYRAGKFTFFYRLGSVLLMRIG